MSATGDPLPTVKGFSSDRFTGGATVNYPIETPKGLGGLTPNLSLNYASVAVDDVLLNQGNEGGGIQASTIGYGWSLGGISYVDRAETSPDREFFSLVLNGARFDIRGGTTNPRLDPVSFATIVYVSFNDGIGQYRGWDVTTPDGTLYRFGGYRGSSEWATNQATRSDYVLSVLGRSQEIGGHTTRKDAKWLLREVRDPLGNSMTYNYFSERGGVPDQCVSTNNEFDGPEERFYHRSSLPQEIKWSGNLAQGVDYKLRVWFEYAGRGDVGVAGSGEDDCIQAQYTHQRLNNIYVQVWDKDANTWHTLHRYNFWQQRDYEYSDDNGSPGPFGSDVSYHMLLRRIDHYGKNGSPLLNSYTFAYWRYIAAAGEGNPDKTRNNVRLRTANNGQGGIVAYEYTKVEFNTCVVTTWCRRYPVTRRYLYDGIANTTHTDYAYGHTAVYGEYDDRNKLRYQTFAGFETSSATDYSTSGTVMKYDFMDFYQQIVNGQDPLLGKLKRQRVWDYAGGRLYLDHSYTWAAYVKNGTTWDAYPANGTQAPVWSRQNWASEWTDGAHSQREYLYETAHQNGGQFGNVTQVKEYDGSTLLRRTTTTYFPNPGNNIVNKPARVRIFDPSGACKSETRFVYDQLNGNYNGLPSLGLLAKTQKALSACTDTAAIGITDPNWTETRWAYDAYGNQIVVHHIGTSAASDDHTITIYDSVYKLFPIEQYSYQNSTFKETAIYYGVNGLSLSNPKAAWGAMQEQCAINEVCTRQAYDAFGRPTLRWELVAKGSAWGSDAQAAVSISYIHAGSNNQTATTVTEWHNPRSEGNFTRKLYNGLGQLIQTQTPNHNWTQEIMVDYAYDALGNLVKTSAPRAISGYPGWPNNLYRGASFAQGVTTTAYDALGRPTQSTAPNGELTAYGYAGRASSVYRKDSSKLYNAYDAYRHIRWQELDGLGYLRTVRQWLYLGNNNWSEQARVTLTHDVAGNLTAVTHPNGLGTTTLTYDLAGRKTAMNDIDLGSWSYAYDRQGKLTRQTDARGKTICLYYENGLERLAIKHRRADLACPAVSNYDSGGYPVLPTGVSVNVIYSYDAYHSPTNRSRGQLTYANTDGQWWQSLAYNSLGLLALEAVFINGAPQTYTTSYTYDAYQRPWKTTYADNETLEQGYNSMGLPAWLYSQWYGWLVHTVNYDELARQTTLLGPLGGNIWRNTLYYPWTGNGSNGGHLQAIRIGTSNGATDRLGLTYTYDSFDNLTSVAESDNGHPADTYAFTYDSHNRLTSGYGQSYSADAAGRHQNFEANFYTGYRAHAITHIGSTPAYAYDANGNLMTRDADGVVGGPAQTLTWDHENHLVGISGGGLSSESYAYDVNGRRVKKVADVLTTFYPNAFYEVRTLDGVASAQVDAAVPPPPPTAEVANNIYLPLIAQPDGLVQSSDLGRTTITKYYYFNGQRIAMRQDGVLTYLHGDHLGSTVLATNSSGDTVSAQGYYAYGRDRGSNSLPTDHQFTGQKKDDTGLMYYGARYYDPQIGMFISPDTLVPDPTHVFDYNRYMYARVIH